MMLRGAELAVRSYAASGQGPGARSKPAGTTAGSQIATERVALIWSAACVFGRLVQRRCKTGQRFLDVASLRKEDVRLRRIGLRPAWIADWGSLRMARAPFCLET